jgi:hypothetical protein
MDDEETKDYIHELATCAMLFYFNDRPPSYHGFKALVDCEFNLKRGWNFEQVRKLGRNFFLVKFQRASHRDRAIEEGPWYMGRRPMHCYAWHTGFNLDTELIEEVPVWIELPLRNQILEPHRRKLIAKLGHLIYYQAGQEHTEYPNDRACILWNLCRQVPKKLKLVYRNTILWQEISFKTMPTSCTICLSTVHLAYECTPGQVRHSGHSIASIPQPTNHKIVPSTATSQPSETNKNTERSNRASIATPMPVKNIGQTDQPQNSHQSRQSKSMPNNQETPQPMEQGNSFETVHIPYLNLDEQTVQANIVDEPQDTRLNEFVQQTNRDTAVNNIYPPSIYSTVPNHQKSPAIHLLTPTHQKCATSPKTNTQDSTQGDININLTQLNQVEEHKNLDEANDQNQPMQIGYDIIPGSESCKRIKDQPESPEQNRAKTRIRKFPVRSLNLQKNKKAKPLKK